MLLPGAAVPGRRGVGLILTGSFYAYAAVLILRVPALPLLEPREVTLALAGACAFYAMALAPSRWEGARALSERFRGNAPAVAGLVVLLVIVGMALVAPLVSVADPIAQNAPSVERLLGPSFAHPLGTDRFGRDIWSRLVFGARVSLGVALLSVLLSVIIGTMYGAASGFAGRRLDDTMMRLVDGFLAFPRLLLVLTIVAMFSNSVALLVCAIAATGWMGIARLVRGEVRRLRGREFVAAAVATGVTRRRLVARHLLPHAIGHVIVAATLNAGAVILIESNLSFLGLGIRPPAPSWGSMVLEGRDVLLTAWWVAAFPALAITIAVVALNLVGDGLRDTLAPGLSRASAPRGRGTV